MTVELSKLSAPFGSGEIEWRIGRSGVKEGKAWGTAFAYVDARAVTKRLDEVCGIEGWKLEKPEPLISDGKIVGFMVGLSILVDHNWVTKWDVADVTDFEPIKGGMSGALRRAAAIWGVGKYLYSLDEGFVETSPDRREGWRHQPANASKGTPAFYWSAPALPAWALPEGSGSAPQKTSAPRDSQSVAASATAEPYSQTTLPFCPKCGSVMRRVKRKDGSGEFLSCTKWKETGCKGTRNIDDVGSASGGASDTFKKLCQVLCEIGAKPGNKDEANAIVLSVAPDQTLEKCRSSDDACRDVLEQIDQRVAVGMSYQEMYDGAMSAAASESGGF